MGNLKSFIGILSQTFHGNAFNPNCMNFMAPQCDIQIHFMDTMPLNSLSQFQSQCGTSFTWGLRTADINDSPLHHLSHSTLSMHFQHFPAPSCLQKKHTFKHLQLENPIFLIKSRLENQVIDAVSFLQRDRITT